VTTCAASRASMATGGAAAHFQRRNGGGKKIGRASGVGVGTGGWGGKGGRMEYLWYPELRTWYQ